MQPLVLEEGDLVVECEMDSSGELEVRSRSVGASAITSTTRHCTVKYRQDLSFASDSGKPAIPPQSSATDEVTLSDLYANFFRLGLQYGEQYRLLVRCWQAASIATFAHIRPRPLKHQRGTRIHPADLDATIQICLMPTKEEQHLRLPFAVETARLQPSGMQSMTRYWTVCKHAS